MDIKADLREVICQGADFGLTDPWRPALCKRALAEIERLEALLERCLSPIEDEFSVTELELTTEIRRVLGKPPWGS